MIQFLTPLANLATSFLDRKLEETKGKAAVAKANQMNKMNLAKYGFYKGMDKQRKFNKKREFIKWDNNTK